MDDINLDELKAKQYTPAAIKITPHASLHLSARGGGSGQMFMNNTFVHHSGALLLERRDMDNLDGNLMPRASEVASAIEHAGEPEMVEDDFVDNGDDLMDVDAGFDDNGDDDGADINAGVPAVTPAANGAKTPDDRIKDTEGIKEDHEDPFDPYTPLDPHDKSTISAKPFKKGNIKSSKRVNAVNDNFLRLSGTDIPEANPAGGPTFKEYDYAFTALVKSLKVSKKTDAMHDYQSMHARPNGNTLQDELEQNFDPIDNNDAVDFFEGEAIDAGEDDDDFEIQENDCNFEMPRPMENLDIEEDDEISYEALCRQHIERILSAAAAEEVRTELAQRVSLWQGKIEPALKEAEERPVFDMRLYEKDIIKS